MAPDITTGARAEISSEHSQSNHGELLDHVYGAGPQSLELIRAATRAHSDVPGTVHQLTNTGKDNSGYQMDAGAPRALMPDVAQMLGGFDIVDNSQATQGDFHRGSAAQRAFRSVGLTGQEAPPVERLHDLAHETSLSHLFHSIMGDSKEVAHEMSLEKTLKSLTPEQLTDLDLKHAKVYGNGLADELMKSHFSGEQKERLAGLFHDAPTVTDMAQMHDAFSGHSDFSKVMQVKNVIERIKPDQVQNVDSLYREIYGSSIREELCKQIPNASVEEHTSLYHYLMQRDQPLSNTDRTNLAELAMKTKDVDLFRVAFEGAPAAVRERFISSDGEARMTHAFNSSIKDWVSAKVSGASSQDYVNAQAALYEDFSPVRRSGS